MQSKWKIKKHFKFILLNMIAMQLQCMHGMNKPSKKETPKQIVERLEQEAKLIDFQIYILLKEIVENKIEQNTYLLKALEVPKDKTYNEQEAINQLKYRISQLKKHKI